MRVYLDTAPVIYLVENVPVLSQVVANRVTQEGVFIVTSDLTRLECRVKPIRTGNSGLLDDYDEFFENAVGEVVAVSSAVIDKATLVRATYNVKVPDAIHLATAVLSGCDEFLTNDGHLAKFPNIRVSVLAA